MNILYIPQHTLVNELRSNLKPFFSLVGIALQIQSSDTTSVVTIPISKLSHSGRYIINAESLAGHKVVKVRVIVLGM